MSVTEVKCELHCVLCRSTYLVPYGPPQLERYNAEVACRWIDEHECVAS